MVAPVAATFETDALTGRASKYLDHIGAHGLVAGIGERGLGTLSIGAGLLANRLAAGDALFQAGGIEIGDAGLDGVEEPVEPGKNSLFLRWKPPRAQA